MLYVAESELNDLVKLSNSICRPYICFSLPYILACSFQPRQQLDRHLCTVG